MYRYLFQCHLKTSRASRRTSECYSFPRFPNPIQVNYCRIAVLQVAHVSSPYILAWKESGLVFSVGAGSGGAVVGVAVGAGADCCWFCYLCC